METSEKKLPVRNLERIAETVGLTSYETAKAKSQEKLSGTRKAVKVKIFARYNGTFDVVWYAKLGEVPTTVTKTTVVSDAVEVVEKKVHGLKAKDRRKQDRKSA